MEHQVAMSSEPEIILDLSRLLSRVLHPTPTGVDRCEMAYARGLLAAVPDRLSFAAVHPSGAHGRLACDRVRQFLDAIEERWDCRGNISPWKMRRFAARVLTTLWPQPARRREDGPPAFYLQASPSNFAKPALVRSVLRRQRARLVCLVHDLIPLQYPEYAREGGAAEHETRIRTILDHAAGIICNSQATLATLRPWMERQNRHPLAVVGHLGTHFHRSSASLPPRTIALDERPYFLCVGTIEPRKNHLLLLNLWRRMAEERDPETVPRLVIVGRRGWENEQVVDMLERCPALQGCVEEHGRLGDADVAALLPGARALLMPSFAEGYGMPVTEALNLGVPVICSDLPALREAGGEAPTYLDPLDGPGWLRTIDDHARDGRVRTVAWRAPSWQDHIAIVIGLLHRLAA